MVITWLPKREMTSTSLDRQKGQRTPCADISLPPCGGGSGWGVPLPTSGHVSLLGEALQHIERRLADASRHGAPPRAVPPGPIGGRVGEPVIDPVLQDAGQVGHAVRTAELSQRAVENAAVSNVVESHRGRRDVRFKAWRGDAPLRVPHPQQLLVVRETLDERVETQVSDSPGPQSRMTASRGTIIISTHRSSS